MFRIENEQRVDVLRQVAMLLDRENRYLHERIKNLIVRNAQLEGADAATLQLELEQLQEILAQRERTIFGPSSEKRPRTRNKASEREPQTGHGPTPQPLLPVVEELLELPNAERVCPTCEGSLEPMGDQTEDSEEITVVQRRFVLIKRQRQKYRCCCNATVVTAPAPLKLIPGGRYAPEFAVEVAVGKYLDHCVPRRRAQPLRGRRSKSCCIEDEGRPLGIGVQAQVPNHLELLGSRARVVSVEGKGAARPRQVRSKKTSVSEPLMTCREVFTRRRNRAGWLARDEPRESLSIDWAASGMEVA